MNFRFNSLLIGALLSFFSLDLSAQDAYIYIDSVEAQAGQEVCVGIRMKIDLEFLSLQGSIKWNTQQLAFQNIRNYNLPTLNASDFNNVSNSGTILFGWAYPSGICVKQNSGDVLFELCFLAIGSAGSEAFVTLDTGNITICMGQIEPFPLGPDSGQVVIKSTSGVLNPSIDNGIDLALSPNPSSGSVQVAFQSAKTLPGKIMVMNALGQLVLEKQIQVIPGENHFEIPASTLNAKGLYQVSLQTEQGIGTKTLSVY